MYKYWFCKTCNKQVDIMIGYNVGIFCIECGGLVEDPKIDDTISPDISDEDVDDFLNNIV